MNKFFTQYISFFIVGIFTFSASAFAAEGCDEASSTSNSPVITHAVDIIPTVGGCKKLSMQTKDFDYHGRKYRIFIAHQKGKDVQYNPLYFLDANSQFNWMTGNMMALESAPVLYVGIGYQDGVDIKKARTFDYTVKSPDEKFKAGGGAEDFYSFISEVLQPWVNTHFNVNQKMQTLAGHSLGGLFVLDVLFNHPKAFNRYVAASPSIWWANGAVIPDGGPKIDKSVDWVSLETGQYEETISSASDEKEKELLKMINANPKYRARDLALTLIKNGCPCSFEYLPGRRHLGVIKDYVKLANVVASQQLQPDGL